MKKIKKQLAELDQVFDLNINEASAEKHISVRVLIFSALILNYQNLARTWRRLMKLGVDYPTYSAVME